MSALTNTSFPCPTSIELLGSVSPPQERENVEMLEQFAQGKLSKLQEDSHLNNENTLHATTDKVRRYKDLTETCAYLAALSFLSDKCVDFITNVLFVEDEDAVRYVAATSSAIAVMLGSCALINWYRQRESETLLGEIRALIEQDEKALDKIRKLLLLMEELQEQEIPETKESSLQEEVQETLIDKCLETIADLPQQIFERTLPSRQIFINAILSLSNWIEVSSILSNLLTRSDIESQSDERTAKRQPSIHFENKGQAALRLHTISFQEPLDSEEAWERLEQKLQGYGLSLPEELLLKDQTGQVHAIRNPLK